MSKTIDDRVTAFVAEIDKSKTELKTKRLCYAELEFLADNYALASIDSYLSRYRNGLKKINETVQVILSLKYLKVNELHKVNEKCANLFQQQQREAIREKNKMSVEDRVNNKKTITAGHDIIRFAIDNVSNEIEGLYDRVIAIAALTGRRETEVITGRFKAINENNLLFSGQLKTDKTDSYEIKALEGTAHKVEKAHRELIELLHGKANWQKVFAIEDSKQRNVRINAIISKTISERVKALFSENLDGITVHSLRAMYVILAVNRYQFRDRMIEAQRLLGHESSETTKAYRKFRVQYLNLIYSIE